MTPTRARLAMITSAVLAAGVAAAVTMTGSAQASSTTLAYSCQFPSGAVAASVRVTANLPATSTAGKAIQPANASVTVTLPPSISGGLAESKATTVTGTARLDMAVAGGASPSDSVWTGLSVPSTAVPSTGNLVLTASGSVPAATATTPGTVTFSPGTLDLALTPRTSSAGATAVPLEANCTPGAGQHAALGSTTVSAATGSAARSAGAATGAAAAQTPYSVCSQMSQGPQNGGTLSGPFPANEYADGYTNASKLDGSALINPAYVTGNYWTLTEPVIDGTTYSICSLAAVQPDYDGTLSLPPFTATFAGFGFVPVTATVQLTEVGLKNPPKILNVTYQQVDESRSSSDQPLQTPFTSVTTARFLLHVLSAKVNGVSLDIGADCQTATPLFTPDSPDDPSPATDPLVVLSGGNGPSDPKPTIGSPVFGGANTGDVTVPPFTGCGTGGDNLDPLFDASVSGPGNYVDLETGLLCVPGVDVAFCGSNNQADTEPSWTVTGGGAFTSTGAGTVSIDPPGGDYNTTIGCASSTASGSIPDAAGPLRGALGSLRLALSGCTNSATGQSWTFTEQGTASLNPACGLKTCGLTTLQGRLAGMTLTATDGTCTLTAGSPVANMAFNYSDPPVSKLGLSSSLTITSISSGCTSTSEFGPLMITGLTMTVFRAASAVTPATINITSPTP